jgi:AcrR family transcriptional regulator
MTQVKRRYDASARRARAEQTRDAVVAAAREQFLSGGFAATKVAEVASACGVSVEYVYKRFGGKAGLLRAVVDRALQGSGPEPAESRSDALGATDPVLLVRGWGRLTSEVAPLVAPVLLLVRAAAEQDPHAGSLGDELDTSRRERMAGNARRLADAGHLRAGVDVEHATDVLWAFSSPELYDLLVVRRGWAADRYGDFVARGIAGALLDPPD